MSALPDPRRAQHRKRQVGRKNRHALTDRLRREETVEVIGGNGNRNLQMAAVRGVKRWRFKPYAVDGVTRPVWARVPVVFRIQR